VHVPNAANGLVKVKSLEAIRSGLAAAQAAPRVLCGDLNAARRELPHGEVISFARQLARASAARTRAGTGGGGTGRRPRAAGTRLPRHLPGPYADTAHRNRAGYGDESRGTMGAGVSTTSSFPHSSARSPASITTPGATRAKRSLCVRGRSRALRFSNPACAALGIRPVIVSTLDRARGTIKRLRYRLRTDR
jgi:hypothetical protein